MRRHVMVLVLALGLSGCMSAQEMADYRAQKQTQLAAAKFAKANSESDPSRIICKETETTGSHMGGKKTCRTAAEWDKRLQQDKDDLHTMIPKTAAPGH